MCSLKSMAISKKLNQISKYAIHWCFEFMTVLFCDLRLFFIYLLLCNLLLINVAIQQIIRISLLKCT